MNAAEKHAQRFLTQLSTRLDRMEWPCLAIALRQDTWIWDQVTQTELGLQALEKLPGRLENWWPGDLALLALDSPMTRQQIVRLPPGSLPPDLSPMVAAAGENWLAWATKNSSGLKEAALLALYLRERGLAASWNEVWAEITSENARSLGKTASSKPLVRAALVLLFEFVPEPEALLLELFRMGQRRLGLHIFFATPVCQDEQFGTIKSLLDDIPVSEAFEVLDEVARLRPALAARLSAAKYKNLHAKAETLPENEENSWGHFLVLDRTAKTLNLAGQPHHALPLLVEALNATYRLQADLAAQLAQAASTVGDFKTALKAWKQALQTEPSSPRYAAGLSITLVEAGKLDEAAAFLAARQEENDQPLLDIAQALLLARQGDSQKAAESASQAVANLEGQVTQEDFYALKRLAGLLLELRVPRQAFETASVANRLRPDDPETLEILARAALEKNDLDAALAYAHALIGHRPDANEHRRLLVAIHESAGNWSAALAERRAWFKTLEVLPVEELRALADCANHAGETKLAVQACRQVLEKNPEDGLAYALLGEAELAQGKTDTAIGHLRKATQLAPDQSTPWMALARVWKTGGQTAQAFETLQAASQAVPNDPEIALALGDAWLDADSPTQALASFRRAAALFNTAKENKLSNANEQLDMRIRLLLGQTLHRLGHLEEAYQTLEPAYQNSHQAGEVDPEVAYAFARVALSQGNNRTAMKALQEVVLTQPSDPAPYLDLARTLLQMPDEAVDKGRAIPLLKRALELDARNPEARAHLAEAYAATGKYESAMKTYRQVLESELIQKPEWRARLAIGFGSTAMKVGQVDAAIAALQEVDRAIPNRPDILRALAEALAAAELYQDALSTARQALRSDPADPDLCAWFADQAFALLEKPGLERVDLEAEAAMALNEAVNLAPNRPELALRLGNIHLQRNDIPAAVKAFEHIGRIAAMEPAGLDVEPLYEAAVHLRALDHADQAIQLLKAATRYLPAPETGDESPEPASQTPADPILPGDEGISQADAVKIWTELAGNYQEIQDLPAALEALEQAVLLAPFSSYLHLSRADYLLQLGRTSLAQASLQEAVSLGFSDAGSCYLASRLLFRLNDLPGALEYAEKTVAARPQDPGLRVRSAVLASELAWSLLDIEKAFAFLKDIGTERILASGSLAGERGSAAAVGEQDEADLLHLAALYGELALERGDVRTAEWIPLLTEFESPHKARLLAVHARLQSRRDGSPAGMQLFEQALGHVTTLQDEDGQVMYQADPAVLRGLSLAGLELNRWDTALTLARSGIQAGGPNPLLHLIEARVLVQRSEAQRLAAACELSQAAPGGDALGETARQAFEQALSAAQSDKRVCARELLHWAARGQAAFSPSRQAAQELGSFTGPLDLGARLLTLIAAREREAAAELAGAVSSGSPAVFFAALALSEANPGRAHRLASQASMLPPEQLPGYWYLIPAAKALQARLALSAETSGAQVRSAIEALNESLSVWPLEAHLQALAARLIIKSAGIRADSNGQPVDASSGQAVGTQAYPALETGEFLAAKAHLEEAIRLEPGNEEYVFELGKLLVENGDAKLAAQYLAKAAEHRPDNEHTWYLLALAEYHLGEFEAAARSADKAVETASEPDAALLLCGEIELQSGNPRSAQNRAKAVLQNAPHNLDALRLFAKSLEAQNRYKEALEVLENAVPLAEDPLPLMLDAVRLVRQTRGGEAELDALRELAERFPDEPRVLAPLSEALRLSGRKQEAVDTARSALGASLNGLTARERARLHTMVGSYLRSSGQLDQAIHHLTAAVENAPDFVEPYLELGQALLDRRQHFQALEVFDRAAAVDPEDYRPHYQAGVALKDGKDYPAAEEKLRRAAELAPHQVNVRRLLSAVVAINLVHNR